MKKMLTLSLIAALIMDCMPAMADGCSSAKSVADDASACYSAGRYDQAARCFAKAGLASLSGTHQEQYRKTLIYSGKRKTAEKPGGTYYSIRNSALDAAFDSSGLTLVKTEFPAVTAEDFEFTDEAWEAYGEEKPADSIAGFTAQIPNADISWLSLSPAGNSGVLLVDDLKACYYAGRYHALYPSQKRGVEDTNGNLAQVFSIRFLSLLGDEGAVYSPDGRYAAIFNNQYALVNAQYFFDPIIIDLSTGEMILCATYGNNPFEEGAGVVTTATFSSDGQYLYYMLFGNITDSHTALYRYNLQKNTAELCYGSIENYLPYLSETADGDFIILRETNKPGALEGITSISYENGTWNSTEFSFNLPKRNWHCRRLLHSASSGYAFAPGETDFTGFCSFFQCIRPDDDFAGLNQYYAIPAESSQIQAYSANEMRSLIKDWTDDKRSFINTWGRFFQEIVAYTLSPDGHYVLLNTIDHRQRGDSASGRHLYLLRLDDLEIKEVVGIEPSAIQANAQEADYKPVIEWNTDTLIIGTSDGIQTYEFQLQ